MLRRLKNWIWGPSTTVWEDERGSVTHRYIFDDSKVGWRARCISYTGVDYTRIEYNIPRLSDYGSDEDDIFVYLINDTMHELTHWACDESDYSENYDSEDPEEHSERWAKVLYGEIEYVHENLEIRF